MKASLRLLILALLFLVYVVPLYVVVVNALKPLADITRDPLGLPIERLTLANLANALARPSFRVVDAYVTSFTVTMLSVVGTLVVSAGLGYVIARERRRWVQSVSVVLLLGMIVPPQVILIPVVKQLNALGLLFTVPGLVLFNIGAYVPFATFIYARFFRTIPRDLDEAAAIDGAGRVRILLSVLMPLMQPATVTLFTLEFIAVWNDFVGPQLILGASTATVTTGLYRAIGQYSTDWSQVFAYALIVSIPVIVLYFVAQGRIVAGLTGGAVKG